jgi:hypothetical protein
MDRPFRTDSNATLALRWIAYCHNPSYMQIEPDLHEHEWKELERRFAHYDTLEAFDLNPQE